MTGGAAPARVALIGLGWVTTQVWLPMLTDHAGFTVVDLVDSDPAVLDRVGRLAPGARRSRLADALSPAEVDLAVVAVPNHLHATIAAALLRRGIAVFVEKPVCLTSAEAAELIEAERAGGARVLAGSAFWHRADVKALRALFDQLGPLRAIDLSWVRGRGIPGQDSWITRRDQAGGGVLFDLGWHLITIGMRMLGWPAVTGVLGSVSADFIGRDGFGATWRDADGSAARPEVEDTASGRVSTVDALVTVTAAWASHTRPDQTRIVVDGALGRAELLCTFGFSPDRVPQSELVLWRDGERTEIEVPQEDVGAEYRRQLDLLPVLLADPGQPGAATAEVAGAVSIVERIYASARPPALALAVPAPDPSDNGTRTGATR
jgi:oxidoreductase